MRAPLPRSRPGLAATVAWLLLGGLGIAVRERWAPSVGLAALRGYGASDSTVALLLSTLPALASLLLVPAVGLRSDRSRSRLGRRRPWLLLCAALAGIGMLGAASARGPVWFCLCWMLFDGAAACAAALFAGLVNDVVPRAFLGRFHALNRVAGLAVAIVFNVALLARTDAWLRGIEIAIALVCLLALPLMCLGVREAPAHPHAQACAHAGARGALAHCLGRPGAGLAFAAFMLAAAAFGPFNTFAQNFALELGLSKAEFGALTAAGYGVSIASAFLIGALADRYGALRVGAAALGLYAPLALGGSLLMVDAGAFRCFYLAHVILSGAYFTAAAAMPAALFPQAEFVRFDACKDSLVAVANIAAGSLAGILLDLSGHAYRLTMAGAALFALACLACLARLAARRLVPAFEPAPETPATEPAVS